MHPQDLLDDAEAVICLSHVRWNFLFQRPHHLMTRCARGRRVYFVEEPFFAHGPAHLRMRRTDSVLVVTPHLPANLNADQATVEQRRLIDQLIATEGLHEYVLWYYTPTALSFTDHLPASAIVYDCLDELSTSGVASALRKACEAELMARAHLVLTGGQALFESRKADHRNIHPFPSSVDVAHFGKARKINGDPWDQAAIPYPRIGFFGVIDDRLDLALIDGAAEARPDWQFVFVGPVENIDRASLPQRTNVHWLGAKSYQEIPDYVAGWDVAMLPCTRNEATRSVSLTKTPEYMAAGLPVVSTSISNVVGPYSQKGLVRVADTPAEFVEACAAAMTEDRFHRLRQHDAFLGSMSWDGTWSRIERLVDDVLRRIDPEPDAILADGAAAV